MFKLRSKYDDYYFRTANISLFRKRDIIRLCNIIARYKRGGELLEIGCGDGKLLNSLKDRFNIRSIDISESAVRNASLIIGQEVVEQKDIENDEISGEYDVVIALNVLEHLHDPYNVLIKIRNSLNKGGIFLFSAPNKYGVYGNISTAIMNFFDKTHISTLKREEWFDIFYSLNLKPLEIINGTFVSLTRAEPGKYICSTLIVVLERGNEN
jgi:SAM-dependent methyltransferase